MIAPIEKQYSNLRPSSRLALEIFFKLVDDKVPCEVAADALQEVMKLIGKVPVICDDSYLSELKDYMEFRRKNTSKAHLGCLGSNSATQ